MDHQAFFDALKAGTVYSVYVFYGPEVFIRKSAVDALKKRLLMPGLEDMDGAVLLAPTVRQLIEACETLPMMSERRVLVVRDLPILMPKEKNKDKDKEADEREAAELAAYLPRVPETTCLIIEVDDALDKRRALTKALLKLPGAVDFEPLGDEQLIRWMNQKLKPMGKRMDAQACQTLAFVSGRDLTQLNGELQKLAAYADGEGRDQITAQDIEAVATHTAECTVFAMVDALSEGKVQQAFTLLRVLLEDGEQRAGIIALITRHYRQMLYLRAMLDERTPQAQLAKALGVPPFAVGRLKRQLGGRTQAQLRALLDACIQADYDFKRGAVRDDAALDRLMFTLSVGTAAQ